MSSIVSAMAVGSLPGTDPVAALELFQRYTPQVLAWPQLPQRSHREDMFIQFTEGLPGIIPGDKARFEANWDLLAPQLEDFFMRYISASEGDPEALATFAISPDYAAGLAAFLAAPLPESTIEIKGQLTGPLSLGLSLTDNEGRAAYYNDAMKDALVKGLAMKASWQATALAAKAADLPGPGGGKSPAILFVDEPSLAYYGSSSFATLDRAEIIAQIDEVIAPIHAAGVRAGVHCCANTESSIVMATAVDLIHFDAYDFPESIYLYPDDLKAFLARGGNLSWGIVPNRPARENTASLKERLDRLLLRLKTAGVMTEALQPRYVSTACGLGGAREEDSAKILALVAEFAAALSGS